MVWQMQSDKTGKVYDFDDDVSQADALKYLDEVAEPAQSWSNTLSTIPRAAQARFQDIQQGAIRFGEDVIRKPLVGLAQSLADPVAAFKGELPAVPDSEFTKKYGGYQEATREALQRETEGVPTLGQQAVQTAGVSALTTLPDIVTGLGAARGLYQGGVQAAEAFGAGATRALTSLAGQEGVAEYGAQREAGQSIPTAIAAGTTSAAAEYLGETIALSPLKALLAGGDKALKAKVFEFLFKDQVGEQLTTGIQALNRKLTREPNMTLDDYVREMELTALSTAISGPVQGAVARPAGMLATAGVREESVTAPERIEPAVEEAPVQPELPLLGTDQIVPQEKEVGSGGLVLDSELPLIGMSPEGTESSSRQLPIEQQLELLRTSWERYSNKSAFDSAEDRIAKRQEFVQRRAQFEQGLLAEPEARTILREADLAMGISLPTIRTDIEREVDEYAVLTPDEIQERRINRSQGIPLDVQVPRLEDEVKNELGLAGALQVDNPVEETSNESSAAAMRPMLESLRVLETSNEALRGGTFDQIMQNIQPGEIAFAATPAGLNRNGAPYIYQVVKDWQQTYLPDRPIVLFEQPANFNHLSAAYNVEGVYFMPIPRSEHVNDMPSIAQTSEVMDDPIRDTLVASVFDTVAHEMTHFIHFRHWQNSPDSEKKAVAEQYHAELRNLKNQTFEEALHTLYSSFTANAILQNFQTLKEIRDLDPKKVPFLQMREELKNRGVRLSPFEKPGYWMNFSEWLAHKGSKYFVTRLGVRKENVNFFRKLLHTLSRFYNEFVKKYKPGLAFSTWMDNIAARESGMQGVLTAGEIETIKKELVAEGMDAEVAALVAEVKGTDQHAINQIKEGLRENASVLKGAENEESDFTKIGGLLEATKASEFKTLSHLGIVRDLLKVKPFFGRKVFPTNYFIDAILSTMVNRNSVRVVNSKQGRSFAFVGKSGNLTYLQRNNGEIYEVSNDFGESDAGRAVKVGLTNFIMRQAAKEGKTKVEMYDGSLLEYYATHANVEGASVEIPFYLQAPPARPNDVRLETDMRMPVGLQNLAKQYKLPFLNSYGNSTARFNAFFSKALGAFQLIKLNAHIPGMMQEREALRNRMAYRHQWMARANARVEEWAYGIPKTEAAKLGRLLFEEAESGKWFSTIADDPNNPGHRIFTLDQKEISARKLEQRTVELYSKIRDDFMSFADEWQKVGLWEIARSEMSDVVHLSLAEAMRKEVPLKDFQKIFQMATANIADPNKAARVSASAKELNDQFEQWKATPYMPYTRFGRYGVLVRDGETGKTKYFAGFDTAAEARSEAEEIRSQFPGDATSTTYLEDVPYMLAGLPPSMLQAMKANLNLTPAQEAEFSEILAKLSHANSFAHRSAKKKHIAGFSQDALRAYSDYFRRGSSFIARTKSEPELSDALGMLKKFISVQTQADGADTVKLGQLHEWFTNLHQYLNDPGNEYGEVKSLISLFHFGFNVSTAVVNMGQVWFATAPYLTERYKTSDVLGNLKNAYSDMLQFYFKGKKLAADEVAMLEHARDAGFRDQSQATVLAQLADGSALARATPLHAWKKGVNTFNHYAMWMFSKGELLNRDVTLIATYRLAKAKTFRGAFDQNAYEQARQAVEDTHNEYERENRPEFMRGAGSVVFQFMHFVQNMLFMMLGGDASWWKLLLVQLGIGGILGLPFAEDLGNFVKFVGRQLGKDWDLQRETRQYLSEVGADPDLFLRGVMSDVAGFDLSKRIALGEVIPGMRALGSHRKFEQVMYDAVGDAAGPAASLVMNGLKFVAENDKTSWNALKQILPTSMKNMGNAASAFTEGAVKDRSGATLFEPSVWDLTGMAVGFQPEELTAKWQERSLQGEQAAFWTLRRGALLEMWSHIALERSGDREAMADFMKRLKDFNANAPDPKLRISGETLRRSVKARLQSNKLREQGFGANRAMQGSASAISETFR